MKNTRNKTSPRHSRKIRGTCSGPRDSAARRYRAEFRRAVRNRKIRGTCDGSGISDAKRSRADLWTDTKHQAGFTIVELLIAMALSAMLLAAIAAAFNGSIINYQQNEDIFKTINSARQALYRITTQLRTAEAVDPCEPNNQCTMITAEGDDITYSYNGADNKLYLITNDDTTDSDYVLCNNVTGMTFTKESVFEGMQLEVKSVQISMTVASGDLQRTIASAAVIRRNLH
jgi:prepilin-type N-terminal cleavage/methylation domain-containing protein